MKDFTAPPWIHSQLRKDCLWVKELPCCEVLLMNNAHWPWLILVPREPNLIEIQDMESEMRHAVFDEVNWAGIVLQKLFKPKKINTAALGNIVSQLHIHVIARFESDPAWPKPVWGSPDKMEYDNPQEVIAKLQQGFESILA
ncbi:MAG: HIT domain-containing protein [Alphaproteobacteria bacterium]|nr:MAG: HIT domain-containing protein [Alphaproteobacteria bacterium]